MPSPSPSPNPSLRDLQFADDADAEPAICGWLTLDIVHVAGDWNAIDGVRPAIEAATSALTRHAKFHGHSQAAVSIALSDNQNVRRLNADYRGQDKATNVLSFEAGADAQEPGSPAIFLGDVVFAFETIAAEAHALAIPVIHHVQHLTVHGILHLNGFDHLTDEEAERMEALETEILASLGVADPYAADEAPHQLAVGV